MCGKWAGLAIVGALVGIASARAYFWMPETHIGVCDTAALSEPYQKTVEFLDSISQLGLTLATALIGLGAGLLLGLSRALCGRRHGLLPFYDQPGTGDPVWRLVESKNRKSLVQLMLGEN